MYYKVLVKCGHVRKTKYILKYIYIKANDGKEAAKIARKTPRVKHDHKDAIREVKEIEFDEYLNGLKKMDKDMYFKIHNSSDQRIYNFTNEVKIYSEDKIINYKKNRNGRRLRETINKKEMEQVIQGGFEYDW